MTLFKLVAGVAVASVFSTAGLIIVDASHNSMPLRFMGVLSFLVAGSILHASSR